MGTFYHITAGAAGNKSRIASPVQKQHRLFFPLQTSAHPFRQHSAQDRAVSFFQFFPHIHDTYIRKPGTSISAFQDKQGKFPGSASIVGIHRRGRGAEHHMRLLQARPLDCSLPCMVAGCHLTFIGTFVFFIDNDQSKIGKRGKQCGTGPQHDAHLTLGSQLHLLITLRRRHF